MPPLMKKKRLKNMEGSFACNNWSVSWLCLSEVLKNTRNMFVKYRSLKNLSRASNNTMPAIK